MSPKINCIINLLCGLIYEVKKLNALSLLEFCFSIDKKFDVGSNNRTIPCSASLIQHFLNASILSLCLVSLGSAIQTNYFEILYTTTKWF